MANLDHLAILKQGVEVWNQWRKDNPDVIPDFSEADLNGAILLRADLSMADLTGANLSRAILIKAKLQAAKLIKANLIMANLGEARLIGTDLGKSDLSGADLFRAHLIGANLSGANLSGAKLNVADLTGASLSGANLSKTDLNRAKLTETKLNKADLNGADLSEADLDGADLTGASLDQAVLKGSNLKNLKVTMVNFKKLGSCRGVNLDRCYGSPRLLRAVADQDFIDEFRENNRSIYEIWSLSSDCGRSIGRWVFWSWLFAVYFGIQFFLMGPDHIKPNTLDFELITMIYYSVVTFTTLGFGDVVPITHIGALWVMAEVIVGYVMLGGLVSIMATKLARRS